MTDTSSKEYVEWMAKVFKKNMERNAKVVHDSGKECDPKPLLRKVCYSCGGDCGQC
jgi:hypothetical protein